MNYEVFFDVTLTSETMPVPLPKKPTREKITALQSVLAQYPQTELTPQHHFADGMYGRTLPIPAETYVVGKIHAHEHLVMLVSGEATINTDKGMERITGPHVWTSAPGDKRALFTHTDCVFFTAHLNPTNTQDLAELEADIITPEPSPFLTHEETGPFANELQRIYA